MGSGVMPGYAKDVELRSEAACSPTSGAAVRMAATFERAAEALERSR
jgi:hypothetical protein